MDASRNRHRVLQALVGVLVVAVLAGGVALRPSGRLLREFGAFSAETRVWVEGDPDPVAVTADALDGLPRATCRLAADELERP